MALTFYYGSGSQYAWRVWLALEHKRVDYSLKVLSFQNGDQRTPEFLAINPRHRVPAITDGSFALYESAAIVEYLDERFPEGPSLFPGDLHQRAVQRRVIREIDGYLSVAHNNLTRHAFFTPAERLDHGQVRADVDTWVAEVARYESALGGDFVGPSLGAADFTLYPFVATAERMEKRLPSLELQRHFGPRVLAWRERMRALPYHDRTWPPHWKG